MRSHKQESVKSPCLTGVFYEERQGNMSSENLSIVVKDAVEQLGYGCWGIEFSAGRRRALLRVFIDHPEGITHDDCSSVSHQLSGVLDVENPIRRAYTLEISSPGIERLLLEVAHYQRYVGSKVRVICYAPLNGRKKFVGRIGAVRDRTLILETDDGCIEIPVDGVKRANLVFEGDQKQSQLR